MLSSLFSAAWRRQSSTTVTTSPSTMQLLLLIGISPSAIKNSKTTQKGRAEKSGARKLSQPSLVNLTTARTSDTCNTDNYVNGFPGEKDIHSFAESRRRRKRRTQASQPPSFPAEPIPDLAVSYDRYDLESHTQKQPNGFKTTRSADRRVCV